MLNGTSFMPSEDPVRRLNDIIENITRIRTYIEGMDESGFTHDDKTIDAAAGL